MNVKLVDSLFEIIKSLTPEEKVLLEEKIQTEVNENVSTKSSEILVLDKKNNLDEWTNKLLHWSERHPRNIPLLSDYAVNRSGIYEEG